MSRKASSKSQRKLRLPDVGPRSRSQSPRPGKKDSKRKEAAVRRPGGNTTALESQLPGSNHNDSPETNSWWKRAKQLVEEGKALGQIPQARAMGQLSSPANSPSPSRPEGQAQVGEPEQLSNRQRKYARRGKHMEATRAKALLRGPSPERSPPLPAELYPIWDEQDPAEGLLACWEDAEAETWQAPATSPGPNYQDTGQWTGPIPKGSGATQAWAGSGNGKKKGKKKSKKSKRRRKRLNAGQRMLTEKGIRRAAARAHKQRPHPPQVAPVETEVLAPMGWVSTKEEEDTGAAASSGPPVMTPPLTPPPLAAAGVVLQEAKAEWVPKEK